MESSLENIYIDNGAWRVKSFSYLYILLSNILAQVRPIGQWTNGPILRWSNNMDHFQCENRKITTLRWLWRKPILVCMACVKKEKEWGTQVCERRHARRSARPMCSRMFEFPHPSPFYYLPCRHTCPILSTRFQWTKPGVRRSLVEKWNRKFSRVHLSYRKFSHDMKPEV